MRLMCTCYITLLVSSVTLAIGNECDKSGILIYEDLGCTPQLKNKESCPIKYSCKGLEPSPTNCYFGGKAYEDKEAVDSTLSSPSCNAGCYCGTNEGTAKFTCAILDCPEWLGVVPLKFQCYRNYTLDSCCSEGQVCPPFDNIEKCVVEGKEYREGEKFSPSNTCLNCVCQKGFKGKFEEPFCKRTPCGDQLRSGESIQASCAPFYSKQWHREVLCCPDDWICPDASEVIKGEAKSEDRCNFGKAEVKVGQYFEKLNVTDGYGRSISKMRCECVIPPLVRCVDV